MVNTSSQGSNNPCVERHDGRDRGRPVHWTDGFGHVWHSRQLASASSQARTAEQFVCETPRRERKWQAHLLNPRAFSSLWHSRQMASASSQALPVKQFMCGMPRRERKWQAHLLDTRIGSHL